MENLPEKPTHKKYVLGPSRPDKVIKIVPDWYCCILEYGSSAGQNKTISLEVIAGEKDVIAWIRHKQLRSTEL